jgi:hypothetical protein
MSNRARAGNGCPNRTLQLVRIRCEYGTDKSMQESMQECLRGYQVFAQRAPMVPSPRLTFS